jgi:hypothetical protein
MASCHRVNTNHPDYKKSKKDGRGPFLELKRPSPNLISFRLKSAGQLSKNQGKAPADEINHILTVLFGFLYR